MATPKKFSMKEVYEILIRKPSDKSILAYLTDTKTSGLENTMDMVYPTGGRGNVYIGGGYGHNRHATMNVSMATWNTEVLAMQNGTEIATGANVTYYDLISKPATGGWASGSPKLTRQLANGVSVGFLYAVADDGTYSKTYEQAETAATGKFTVAADGVIGFFAGDEPTTDYVACAYESTATTSKKLTIEAGSIPPTVLVSAYGLAKDVCDGELYPCVIDGLAQVDGNWSFDVSADGDPAVQSFKLEFVRNCASKELYTFTIFEDTDTPV